MDAPLETELKVRYDDPDRLRAEHPELVWDVVEARHFEDNFVFELPDAALERRGSILRLRIAKGVATLTYKGLVPESASSPLKIREELETGVSEPEVLAAIFERLGLRRTFRYQKYRAVYRLQLEGGAALAMIDELPFGGFVEVEGEALFVNAAARALGLDPGRFIRESYIGIQAALCRARGVALQDLVFAAEEPA